MEDDISEAFLIEAKDLVEGFGDTLIAIEEEAFKEVEELISKGFREIHTVKGSAGFLGFGVIEALSHAMENLLAKARSKELKLNRDNLTVLLESTKRLEECIDLGMESNELEVSDLIEQLTKAGLKEDELPAKEIAEESKFWEWPFPQVDSTTLSDPETCYVIRSVNAMSKDDFGKAKAELSKLGHLMAEVQADGQSSLFLLSTVLDTDMLMLSVPGIELDVRSVMAFANGAVLKKEAKTEDSKTVTEENPASDKPKAPASSLGPTTSSESGTSTKSKTMTDATLRVKVDLLEGLMGLASELVLSRNQVMDKIDKEGKNHFNVLSGQITELQDAVMKLRLQPLQVVFSKLPRMVRQLATQLNKDAHIEIKGKDVEVDRTMVESLSDPLTHIIRNSMDHGLESREDRLVAGKRAQGQLMINAYSQGGNVHIDIIDDGNGIDPERVGNRAVENGVLTKDECRELSDAEKQALIFEPGFSTADAVSSVSGRGVGMDVVRSKIEGLGGKVLLFSTKGKGTTLRLLLPMTLAVVPALIVESDGIKVAIPRVNISELVLLDGHEGNRIERMGDQPVFRLRGEILSVDRLGRAIGVQRSFVDHDGEERNDRRHLGDRRSADSRSGVGRRNIQDEFDYLIVLKVGSSRFGILVDQLLPPEEIVVKPLPSYCLNCQHFSGVSILGNGMVVPIINPLELAQLAKISLSEKTPGLAAEKEGATSATHYWLVARTDESYYAIPQQLVKRIDECQKNELQWVDDQYYKIVGETSIPLISMYDIESAWETPKEAKKGFLIIPKFLPIEVGIQFDEIIGIIESTSNIDGSQRNESFMGKVVIQGHLTKIIDVYGLTGAFMPELKKLSDSDISTEQKTDLPNLRILVAEDSPIFRSIMKKTLGELGYPASFCNDGQEALEELRTSKYDILLSDLEMPNMDGFELLEQLKKESCLPSLCSVALTGNQDEKVKEKALAHGFDHFMIKFDKIKLGAWLEKVHSERVPA